MHLDTLPETNSSSVLKITQLPKGKKLVFQNINFQLRHVSFREGSPPFGATKATQKQRSEQFAADAAKSVSEGKMEWYEDDEMPNNYEIH